ncbi:unnamed protein product [Chironomus riparius]|uniref:DED domain-containing protein n=1 Tax=Chironomus riparius TaxID=315576 RepID=A0A9N9RKT7_9DIPT|nr:unnamed protein product [Chironomus riparius]
MSILTIKSSMELNSWKEKLHDVTGKLVNEPVKEILSSIKDFDSSSVNEDEYFRVLATKMNDLSGLKLHFDDLEVIDLITNVMMISSNNSLTCIKFAKINFKLFYSNSELTKSTVFLENFIKSLCLLIVESIAKTSQNESRKFAKVQLCIIIELQHLFTPDDFRGNQYIERLFIKLINEDISELEEQFTTILSKQLENSKFCQDMFIIEQEESYNDFLRYCLLILQQVGSQDVTEKEANFVCLLISSLAKHIDILDNDTEIFDYLLIELTNLIVKLNISNQNFEIIELQLIEGIIGNDYSLSVMTFLIMCQFVLSIGSTEAIKSYFVLFQDLLLHMWNPVLQFCELRQVYIGELLKIMYNTEKSIVKMLIKPSLMTFFNDSDDKKSEDFTSSFLKLKFDPTSKNYYNLISSSLIPSEKSSKELISLIQVIGSSDWKVFSSLVINIIDLIATTKDHEKKMLYLLKFNPLKAMKKLGNGLPIQIAHKLLEMCLTFMSKTNGCNGLKNYIKTTLDMLLERDVSLRRLYLNLRMSKTVMIKEEETLISNIEDMLKASNTVSLKHLCKEKIIGHKEESCHLENLEKMLIYSKWLSNQNNLTPRESEIIDQIVANLKKVST